MPEAQWILAEALELSGRGDEAGELEASIIAAGGSRDARTVALFLATRGQDPTEALDLAREELAVREDVFTLDAYAWALSAAGKNDEASEVIEQALEVGTRDGRLFYHAGVIAALDRQDQSACRWFGKAIAIEQTLLPSEQRDLHRLSRNCTKISQ
jgi:tetratricopeptide (TPR) repeat protein